jgi:hypothetical protein
MDLGLYYSRKGRLISLADWARLQGGPGVPDHRAALGSRLEGVYPLAWPGPLLGQWSPGGRGGRVALPGVAAGEAAG